MAALNFKGFEQFPVLVVTTTIYSGKNRKPKWWQKNFLINGVVEGSLLSSEIVQFFCIDESLFENAISFPKVLGKIGEAVSDTKNAPVLILVDSQLSGIYREKTAGSFVEDKLSEVFGTVAPKEIIIPENDPTRSLYMYEPRPKFRVNIGSLIPVGNDFNLSSN